MSDAIPSDRLYGDDFTLSQIEAWYHDEAEAYADLGAKDATRYEYLYHALNQYHGYRWLPDTSVFQRALGFGSAYGYELAPIASRIRELTIVDPSEAFRQEEVYGIPTTYVRPALDGSLPFADSTFDLITCLGVLHHIPNVSYVLGELSRCLRPGARMLVREPVISMGDWRHPRIGLTKHERGIPLKVFREMIAESNLMVEREHLCRFAPWVVVWDKLFEGSCYNSPLATRLDAWLARAFARNLSYHATSFVRKFRPTNVFYVLSKPSYAG